MNKAPKERYGSRQAFHLSARMHLVEDLDPFGPENYNRQIVAINDEAYTDIKGLIETIVSFLNDRVLHWKCPACERFGTCSTQDDAPVDTSSMEEIRGDLLAYGLAVPDKLKVENHVLESGRDVQVYLAYCGCDMDF